jgi:multidrug transporter EmrE-like cation transporter
MGGVLMLRTVLRSEVQAAPSRSIALSAMLIAVNLLFNIIANASFKVSVGSPTWRGILTWQVIGNLAGFVTVVTLTGLLRFLPLHVAFTVTTGLSVVGVQVVAAWLLFHEPIPPARWVGTLLVVAGIAVMGSR